jgi:RsiW-degrading membrane proteinase PrsW (M82 family)
LKGFAVLLVFIFFYREFDSVLDGIIYATVTALGFAATENSFYIYTQGFLEKGFPGLGTMVFIRVILVGWQHPYYTAFFGIGLAIARLNRNTLLKLFAPIAGITIGIVAHSFHNPLLTIIPGVTALVVGTTFDWTGWIIMFIFILLMIYRDGQLIVKNLQEQYLTACSANAQGWARFKVFLHRRYQTINRFYQLCGELAHKKNQLARVGDEGGNTAIIIHLQEELKKLSSLVA